MIPLKLKMRNFMCYRGNMPPLDFASLHTACLSGDNGSGKSALIDAMTWALWGEARAKSDDDLIHSHESEMEVEFDFAVGDERYRITRKHAKPKLRGRSGQSSLDLLIASSDGFKVISGDGITQTQQKITKEILHMDYQTFINSTYLRQGHADEFTIKPPAKRKEVLAEILGLSFYDRLEEQAKELAKQKETEKTRLESNLKDITAELAQKPAYQAELAEAQRVLSQIDKSIKENETKLSKLRQEKETLEKKKAQLEELETSLRDRKRSLEILEEQISQHHSRIKEYETLITQRVTIAENYSRFLTAKKLNDELNQKLKQQANLNQRQHHLEMTITQAGQELVKEHALAQKTIRELEGKIEKLPQLQNQWQKLREESSQFTAQEESLRQKKQTSQQLQTQVNYLESNQTQLEREIKELNEKIDLLSTQTEAKCPLCETELGIDGLKLIASKYIAERQNQTDSLKLNQTKLTQKKLEFESLEKEVSRLETKLTQEKITSQSKAGILKQEMTQAEEAGKQIVGERKKLVDIELHLATKDFARLEQEALKELEIELAKIDYNSEQHEQVRQQLTSLEQFEGPQRRLEEADRHINQEKEASAKAEAAAQELKHRLEVDHQKKQALTVEVSLLPHLVNDITQAEAEQQVLSAQQKQAQEALGSAKAKLQRCAELEIKKQEKEEVLAQAAKEEDIYQELAKAFGKGGVPALLIETALPEIEIEANRLLGRMTDNRMHLKFATQKESKKGDAIETLDINISDELGTRSYDMFSGGEAFRINFAIRIALSKLLARRAGAPLPTLIIDEGFGTQDSTGIEKLKEAITSIQNDFDKLIVITHLEELRDAFPTRIEVVKTAEGSTLSVS